MLVNHKLDRFYIKDNFTMIVSPPTHLTIAYQYIIIGLLMSVFHIGLLIASRSVVLAEAQ